MHEPQQPPSTPTDSPNQHVPSLAQPETTHVLGSHTDAQPIPQSPSGPRYGRFAVERFHAMGGLGEVHVALDEELRRPVALKMMRDRCAADPSARRRFLNEAAITAKLEHPGIVPIYGLAHDEHGRACYAMRFIEGESLAEAIRKWHASKEEGGRMKDEKDSTSVGSSFFLHPSSLRYESLAFRHLLQRFISVCQTMAYAHSKLVIHRDLKPANVMLGPYGETLVVDWGLARELPSAPADGHDEAATTDQPSLQDFGKLDTAALLETQPGQALGTPGYMAPEQAAGKWSLVGPGSDIYSLGATLYDMLIGASPFRSQDAMEALQKAQRGDFPAPRAVAPGVPRPLEAICLKAMALDPADRYASAADLAADVDRWLADEPVAAWREPWTVRARRWRRRHRATMASCMAAITVAAVLLGVLAFVIGHKNSELKQERDLVQSNLITAKQLATEIAQKNSELAKERDLAQTNFTTAKRAVDQGFLIAKDHALFQGDEHRERRKLLLEAALPFYRDFQKQKTNDPDILNTQADNLFKVGYIENETGDEEAALRYYGEARELWQGLVTDHPETVEFQYHLANAWGNLGLLQSSTGRTADAERSYSEALAILKKLVAAYPSVVEYQRDLGLTWNNFGSLQRLLGRAADAERSCIEARSIQEKMVAAHPKVTEFQRDLAVSWQNVGHLERARGQVDDAERSMLEAGKLLRKLVTDHPGAAEYKRMLARSLSNLGLLQSAVHRTDDADRSLLEAKSIQEALVAAHPGVTAYQSELARTWHSLGLNQYVTGRTADAERSFNEAKSLRQKVVAGHAANIDHQKDLATSFSMLAHFHGVAGRYDEADSNFQEAKTIEEKLVADHPNDAECALSLSMTYGNRGNLLQRRGQSAEALPYYAQSLKVLEPVLARNPRSADARQSARNSHGARADALVKLRRYADALPDWDQVIALNDDPQRRTWIRIQRAVCLAHAGQTARAVAEAEVLAAVKDAPGALLYDLARICAVASAVGDSNNPGADAPRLAEQYAARAVELLRQAAERGFKDIGYLKKDDDLKLLREREDYKQMLKELDDKSK